MTLTPLPIDEVIPELVAHVRVGRNVVLHAPTGAGKTTRVPVAVAAAFQVKAAVVFFTSPAARPLGAAGGSVGGGWLLTSTFQLPPPLLSHEFALLLKT